MSGTYKVNGDRLTGLTVYSTLPIGTVIASFTNSEVGFLPCDHSEYNQSDFPELYAKLQNIEQCQSENEGKFYVPDLRESGLVGVGTSNNEDIVTHDTYVVGEFKDDQLQGHAHTTGAYEDGIGQGRFTISGDKNTTHVAVSPSLLSDNINGTPRIGSTTHGKQTGVYYLIKATDYVSLPQNAIDDTRTTNANAYSAEKVMSEIGKASDYNFDDEVIVGYVIQNGVKKPIYRKFFVGPFYNNLIDPNNTFYKSIINFGGYGKAGTDIFPINNPRTSAKFTLKIETTHKLGYLSDEYENNSYLNVWVEYTKTTN